MTASEDVLSLFVLKGRPYLAAYAKIINFYRVKTDSKSDLLPEFGLSSKGDRNVLARGEIPAARMVGTMFSPYYSALVAVTSL